MPSFATYNSDYMNRDLSWYFGPEYAALFAGRYLQEFLARPVPKILPAWHLVGGKDLLLPAEGMGYRVGEIARSLPGPSLTTGPA
jgi:hypothetical protein